MSMDSSYSLHGLHTYTHDSRLPCAPSLRSPVVLRWAHLAAGHVRLHQKVRLGFDPPSHQRHERQGRDAVADQRPHRGRRIGEPRRPPKHRVGIRFLFQMLPVLPDGTGNERRDGREQRVRDVVREADAGGAHGDGEELERDEDEHDAEDSVEDAKDGLGDERGPTLIGHHHEHPQREDDEDEHGGDDGRNLHRAPAHAAEEGRAQRGVFVARVHGEAIARDAADDLEREREDQAHEGGGEGPHHRADVCLDEEALHEDDVAPEAHMLPREHERAADQVPAVRAPDTLDGRVVLHDLLRVHGRLTTVVRLMQAAAQIHSKEAPGEDDEEGDTPAPLHHLVFGEQRGDEHHDQLAQNGTEARREHGERDAKACVQPPRVLGAEDNHRRQLATNAEPLQELAGDKQDDAEHAPHRPAACLCREQPDAARAHDHATDGDDEGEAARDAIGQVAEEEAAEWSRHERDAEADPHAVLVVLSEEVLMKRLGDECIDTKLVEFNHVAQKSGAHLAHQPSSRQPRRPQVGHRVGRLQRRRLRGWHRAYGRGKKLHCLNGTSG
eukprot:scaffold94850_cov64-Phaeocystis_antarctica.AAC.4